MTFLFLFPAVLIGRLFYYQNERSIRLMKKTWKRLCTGFLALATVVTALPTTPVHAESKQYWTESKERVGIVEKVMNDGSIGSTFNEGHLKRRGRGLPTVLTLTQILRMVTRPELTQAHV